MIRIITRRVLRFYNPTQQMVINRTQIDGETGKQIVVQDLAIPAAVTVGRGENAHKDLFFDTVPGDVQEAPDWIEADTADKINITTFKNAVADGTLIKVNVVEGTTQRAAEPEAGVAPKPGQAASFPVIDGNTVAQNIAAESVARNEPARPLAGGKAKRNL